MSFLSAHHPLARLLKDSGTHPGSLLKIALQKASDLLRSLPDGRGSGLEREEECSRHDAVLQCMEILLFLLPQAQDEDLVQIGVKVVGELCDPYLIALSSSPYFVEAINRLKLAAHVQVLGNVLGTLLQSSAAKPSLGDDIVKFFVELFCNQRFCDELHRGSAVNPAAAISVLDHTLSTANPNEIESGCFSLSSLFDSAIHLLQHSDLQTCYCLTSTIFPLFVTYSHLERVERMWDFIVQVRRQKLHVNSVASDLVLTVLCCFSNLFISYDRTSPFSSRLPKFLSDRRAPVYDLRKEPVFWSIVQEGLVSLDPVSRKRCVYLLHCVLVSVRGEDVEDQEGVGKEERPLAVEGGVFWWSAECSKELGAVWDSLMLVIETMEEKQVGNVAKRGDT